MIEIDLMVSGRVVTMDQKRTIIDDGAVAIAGSKIVAVGSYDQVNKTHSARRHISLPRAIIIPGLIDCHTHMSQTLVRGLIAHELPMINRIYIPATLSMTAEQSHTAASLCAAQLLSSGVTTVCEGAVGVSQERIDAIVQAVEKANIRCNLVRGIGDQEFHHAALYSQANNRSYCKPRAGQAECDLELTAELLKLYPPGTDSLVTSGVCASHLTTYSERYFTLASDLAANHGAKLHVHASRDREEVEFTMAVFGRRPIEQLHEIGVLQAHTVLAHAMLSSEKEIVLMGQAGCSVAHSAVECLNILNAIPNVKMMKMLGVTVGLGCDNAANDMFTVMRAAWLLHTAAWGIQNYDPEVLTSDDILAMATIEAARLLGLDEIIGSLEIGKEADLVVLDGSDPQLLPTQGLVSDLVRYGSRGEVRFVLVGGQVVVEPDGIQTVDIDELAASADESAKSLRKIAKSRRYKSLCH